MRPNVLESQSLVREDDEKSRSKKIIHSTNIGFIKRYLNIENILKITGIFVPESRYN